MRSDRPPQHLVWGAGMVGLIALLAGCGDRHLDQVGPASGAPALAAVVPTTRIESSGAAEVTCGAQGMPDCPLQRWMDDHLNGPLSREEYPGVARSFHDLAAIAPSGFTGWGAWAQGGAAAAERRDDAGIRKACAGCHEGYRARYRKTLRERPLPPADPP